MGSSRSINIIEFSWMKDGALIVTTKILVPPDLSSPRAAAGCTGAFALFANATPGALPPTVPVSLVSFVEAPRCPVCTARGSLGCYCTASLGENSHLQDEAYSSAIWPPRIANDVKGSSIDTYHNIRSRLDLIQHISHVKITAHLVTGEETVQVGGLSSKSYKLGSSRFVVRAVLFRPANSLEADTLRQVADKLRLLRSGSLRVQAEMQQYIEGGACSRNAMRIGEDKYSYHDVAEVDSRPSADVISCPSVSHPSRLNYTHFPDVSSEQSSHDSSGCGACSGVPGSRHTCSLSRIQLSEVTGSRTVSVNNISKLTETRSVSEKDGKKIPCPRCTKSFSQQGSLNRHLKNIHDAQKIPCAHCSMAFGQMFDLKVSFMFQLGR